MFLFSKEKTGYDINFAKKLELFSGAILHGTSKEPDAYLDPSQTSAREHFCKNT